MRTSICLFATLVLALPAAAEIYRTVDAQGNVVFTDVPPQNDQATRVTVEPVNSYEVPAPVQGVAGASDAGSIEAEVDAGYYAAVEIVDPANDEAIRANDGNMIVSVAVSPPLRGDHRLVLSMDGRDLEAASSQGVFRLTNLDRGSHTAVAKVLNSSGAVVKQSAPVAFHMLRVAVGAPKPPPPKPKPSN
jgi:hypothetical protein